ncbi:MAG: hypothetical protein AAFV71_04075 [Cyanobacteria bacterium J06633_8]
MGILFQGVTTKFLFLDTLFTKVLAMLAQIFKKPLVFVCLFSCISISSCTKDENTGNFVKASKKTDEKQTIDDNSSKFKTQKIQGKLIYE